VQASAAGLAVALGGVVRDLGHGFAPTDIFGSAAGYNVVYSIEIVLLFATLAAMLPLVRRAESTGTAAGPVPLGQSGGSALQSKMDAP
jgi:BCD family chlorophyll transporter-like MFS transporter